jgi:sec-independent protein translocase protein TatA
MGGLSIWHWLIVGAVALLLFGGKGKISDIMGDVAKGIKSFKKGLSEDDEKTAPPPSGEAAVRSIDHLPSADPAKVSETRKIG